MDIISNKIFNTIQKRTIRILIILVVFVSCIIDIKANDNDSLQYISSDNEHNLIIASWKGDYNVVERIISKGTDVNTATEEGITPLMYASQNGHVNVMRLLLSKGADVNMRPQNGRTALMAAIRGGHIQAVELLLQDSANINATDEFKRTPLLLAAAFADSAICNKLIQKGADIYVRDRSGANMFLAAVQNNNLPLALYLTKFEQDINSVDFDGVSAMHIVVGKKDLESIDLLLKNGANINLVTKQKQSPLTLAIEQHDEILVQQLVDRGADVNSRLSLAETPYTVAKYVNADKFLLEVLENKGAKQNLIPDFRRFSIGPEISWNLNDFMAGFNLGIKECKYNFDVTGGMLFRLFPVRVLNPISGNQYYQFWERRTLAYAGVNKNFNLFGKNTRTQRGVSIGLKEGYTFGSYRGSSVELKSRFITIPELGLYQSSKYWQLGVAYQYTDYKAEGVSPHRITINFRIILGGAFEFNLDNYQPWD